MKHTFSVVGMTMLLLGAVWAFPGSASAAFNPERIAARERMTIVTTISPGDADALELLGLLGITLAPTSPTWSDANFIAMVNEYKSIKSRLANIIIDGGDLALDAFDLIDYAGKVQDEQFAPFVLTDADRAELDGIRAELETGLAELRANPDQLFNLLEEFARGFDEGFNPGMGDELGDIVFDDNAPYAYGYSEPYEAVAPGQLVWLYDSSYNPLDTDTTVTWKQLDGPELIWINTTCDTCRAFIAPSLVGYDYDYLTFELTVDNGVATHTNYVYVYINEPQHNAIADLFRDVYGSDPDQLTIDYWQSVYDRGFTLDQIRSHFELLLNQRDANV